MKRRNDEGGTVRTVTRQGNRAQQAILLVGLGLLLGSQAWVSACAAGTPTAPPTSTHATTAPTTEGPTSAETSRAAATTIVADTRLCRTLLDIFSHAPKSAEVDADMVSLHDLKPALPADQQALVGQMEAAYAVANSNSYGPFAAALNRLGTAANC